MYTEEVVRQKIESIFHGVQVTEWPNHDIKSVVYRSVTSPHSYLVKMVIMKLAGRSLERYYQKSDWVVALKYNGSYWIMEDWKRSKWILSGENGKQGDADKLIKKIESASKVMENFLTVRNKEEINKNNFELVNHFNKINSMYSVFKYETVKIIDSRKESTENISTTILLDMYRHIWDFERKIEGNVIAAVFFFFSLCEVIFDCCYSLGVRKVSKFTEFRNMSWTDRLKQYFNVGEGYNNEIFSKLSKIREDHRNAFIHSEPTYYILHNDVGWIPSNSKDLHNPLMTPISSIDVVKADEIFAVFDETLAMIQNDPFGQFAYLYATTGLPILMNLKDVKDLQRFMVSLDSFSEELYRRSQLHDDILNMDI